MRRVLIIVSAILVGSAAAVGVIGQTRLSVKGLMTDAEFRQSGLHKLGAAELVALDQWLTGYTQTVIHLAREQKPARSTALVPSPTRTPAVIESCIDGEFNGWEGETIFKLCNGQIWQQAEYAYMFSYQYRPDVVIYQTSEGYRMKVEDEDETILVKRLR